MSLPPRGKGLRVLSQSQANVTLAKENTGNKNTFEVNKLRDSLPIENGPVREKRGLINRVLATLGLIKEENTPRPTITVLEDVDAVEEEPKSPPTPLINFSELGIFNDIATTHPDFDNDILNYCHHIQARNPENLASIYEPLGGERVFSKLMNHLISVVSVLPLPTEVVYLASHYVNNTVARASFTLDELDLVCLASIQIASKAERQGSQLRNLGYRLDSAEINRYELIILQTISFKILPSTTIQFMRLMFPLCRGNHAFWAFAKFASQLMLTNIKLASVSSTLHAGIVMRLACYVAGGTWTDTNNAIVQEDSKDYEEYIDLLCKVILIARENRDLYDSYHRVERLVDRIIRTNYDFFMERCQAVRHEYVYEKRRTQYNVYY